MQRPHTSYASDSESLQADVMRFMAIIAFCLIAILALVRNTEEAPAESSVAAAEPLETTQTPDPIAAESAAREPEPEPEPVVMEAERVLEAEPTLVEPAPQPEPAEIEAAAELAAAEPTPPAAQQAATPQPAAMPVTGTDAVAAAESPTEEEAGLTLRFASDGDFLRLIARGDIRVYAFQDSDVLALSESYRFLDSSAPGQVYELLPPSIPGLIVDALRQARSETAGYRWGIALPGRISHQIEQHLHRVSRGELVIDRYGDVHHVAAS